MCPGPIVDQLESPLWNWGEWQASALSIKILGRIFGQMKQKKGGEGLLIL